jgi:integrase
MARPSKVWHRSDLGWWMITLGGEKVRLVQGPKDKHHEQLAQEKYGELLKLRRLAPQAVTARAADLAEAFLAWSRSNLAEDTHRINRYYLQLFAEHCGQVPAREIKPYHVTQWVTAMQSPERVRREREEWLKAKAEAPTGQKRKLGSGPRPWGETCVYNARKIAFRVFSWARKEGLLPVNPLEGMERPKPTPRQRALGEDEFRKMYEQAGGPFRDVLRAMWLTGARPKEVRDLKWAQVEEGRWVISRHKTSRKVGKPRVIYLDDEMKVMMARLKGNGHANVFLNTEGEPWTMNAVRLQVYRLKKALGLSEDVCAYLCRHGFGTRAVLKGQDAATVAELMGHSSLDMVSKVYVHLAEEQVHLAEAVRKINSSATPAPTGMGPVRKRAKPVKKSEK